jgi:3-oxosteroid 1-dehydrogenase
VSDGQDGTAADAVRSVDVLIVGSGVGGLTAALAAASVGKSVLLVEKTERFGGSSALSGGMVWLPTAALLEKAGIDTSKSRALTYMRAVVGDSGPATSDERLSAFLDGGASLSEFLGAEGIPMRFGRGYVDYFPEQEGGEPGGRALEPRPFDLRRLGDWGQWLPPNRHPLVVYGSEAPRMVIATRSARGFMTAARVMTRTGWARLRRRPLRTSGNALVCHLLYRLRQRGVEAWRESPLTGLIAEAGVVTGARVEHDGRQVSVTARDGVVLAGGGFSHNSQLRAQWQPRLRGQSWSAANPGDTGVPITSAVALGAAVDLVDEAWWMPMTLKPDGSKAMILWERSLPHAILVDQTGRRFVNESANYMVVGQAVLSRNEVAPAIPCWLIMDSRHRRRYPFISVPGGLTPSEWLASGFMLKADTLGELARDSKVDPAALAAEVAHFNDMVLSGRDADFHRGESGFDRTFGDPRNRPNPNLGAIERGPFYAVAVYPGDVGTCGGLLTDGWGRVLREDASPIPGLYATGNCTATVAGRTYPGPGASIANAMVFGYRAVQHLCRDAESSSPG